MTKKQKEAILNTKILRVMELALQVSEGQTEGKPTVFVDFSGHVNVVSVQIHDNGWKAGSPPTIVFEFRIKGVFMECEKGVISTADKCIAYLEALLERA